MDNRYGKLLNTCLCFRDKQDIARDYVDLIIGIDKIKKELVQYYDVHSREMKDSRYCVAVSVVKALDLISQNLASDDIMTITEIMEALDEQKLQRDSKKSD